MPKGRRFVPGNSQDGIWVTCVKMPKNTSKVNKMREYVELFGEGTTTGLMMTDPFREEAKKLSVARCPPLFHVKHKKNYHTENPFSWHDNRNSFQDHGIYFGKGLGKKKVIPEISQHKSNDIVTWEEKLKPETLLDINSLYREDFNGERCSTAPIHRRYSKSYPVPPVGQVKLTSNTTLWVADHEAVPTTFLQTLANTQEPYQAENLWKYSYHAKSFAASQPIKTVRSKRSKIMTTVN